MAYGYARGGKGAGDILHAIYLMDKIKDLRGTREQRRDLLESQSRQRREAAETAGQKRAEQQIFRTTAAQAGPGATEADVKKYFPGTAAVAAAENTPTTTMQMERPGFFRKLLGNEPYVREEHYAGRPEYTEDRKSAYLRPPDTAKIEETGKKEAAQLRSLAGMQVEETAAPGVERRFREGKEFFTPEKVIDESTKEFGAIEKRQQAKLTAAHTAKADIDAKYAQPLHESKLALDKATISKDKAQEEEARTRIVEINQKILKEARLRDFADKAGAAMASGDLELRDHFLNLYDFHNGNGDRVRNLEERYKQDHAENVIKIETLHKTANAAKTPEEKERIYNEINGIALNDSLRLRSPYTEINVMQTKQGAVLTGQEAARVLVETEIAEVYHNGRLAEAARTGQAITLRSGKAKSGAEAATIIHGLRAGRNSDDIIRSISNDPNIHPEVKRQAIEMISERASSKSGESAAPREEEGIHKGVKEIGGEPIPGRQGGDTSKGLFKYEPQRVEENGKEGPTPQHKIKGGYLRLRKKDEKDEE